MPSPPREDARGSRGGYEELPGNQLPDGYDHLGERGSDYDDLTDLDLTKDKWERSTNLFYDTRNIYQSIHSRSMRKISQVSQTAQPEAALLRRVKSFSFDETFLHDAPIKLLS
ncbi:hypothetical protein ElyMa_003133500 [Elysia marginata]|uniref:Uncharacterized protein n=1 Tax=Elysia marginata TaxID=1093978 RepID=A0AAV4IRW8_9GAST|nr:hypothetical protein ElyMa_003133500 [Elysia marginata]